MFSKTSPKTPKVISHTSSDQNLNRFMLDNDLTITATIGDKKIVFKISGTINTITQVDKKLTIDKSPNNYINDVKNECLQMLHSLSIHNVDDKDFQFDKITLEINNKKPDVIFTYTLIPPKATEKDVENKIEELLEKLQIQISNTQNMFAGLIAKFNSLRKKKRQEQEHEQKEEPSQTFSKK